MKRRAKFVLQNIGGENVLVPFGSQVMDLNGIVTLNVTGCFLWEHLSEDRSLDDLALAATKKFDVDYERVRIDIQHFLDEISSMGLLES
jgi:hypothetical protein